MAGRATRLVMFRSADAVAIERMGERIAALPGLHVRTAPSGALIVTDARLGTNAGLFVKIATGGHVVDEAARLAELARGDAAKAAARACDARVEISWNERDGAELAPAKAAVSECVAEQVRGMVFDAPEGRFVERGG